MRLGRAEAGTRGHHDDEAGLVPKLGRRGTLDHFHRLHGVGRELIREYLTLLVSDRLAIDGERVRGVIAKAMKETIRIGGDSRRRQSHEGTQRRGVTFERKFIEEIAIHIGMSRRIGFQQVSPSPSPSRWQWTYQSEG